jgi:hypothetical protein
MLCRKVAGLDHEGEQCHTDGQGAPLLPVQVRLPVFLLDLVFKPLESLAQRV